MSKILIDRSVLEQALEALNPTASGNWTQTIALNAEAAIHALRAALEQSQIEQDPEAWGSGDGYWVQHIYKQNRPNSEIYNIPFYTHPQPKREPLTDKRIREVGWAVKPYANQMEILAVARAIEEEHEIK